MIPLLPGIRAVVRHQLVENVYKASIIEGVCALVPNHLILETQGGQLRDT